MLVRERRAKLLSVMLLVWLELASMTSVLAFMSPQRGSTAHALVTTSSSWPRARRLPMKPLQVLPGNDFFGATSSPYYSLLWLADANEATAGLSKQTAVAVFVVGLIPFAIATVEFWRRIAAGSSFGTSEPVVFTIGQDDAPESSRGKQVLGKDALVTAYAIFAVMAVVLALVLYAVTTSPDQVYMPSSSG